MVVFFSPKLNVRHTPFGHARLYEVFLSTSPLRAHFARQLVITFKRRRRANTATASKYCYANVPEWLCDRNAHRNLAESKLL